MEMLRVLRVGGRCLVYVWARDQRRGERNSTYLSEKRTSKAGEDSEDRNEECRPFGLPVHTNRSNFKHSDLLVPWKMVSVLAAGHPLNRNVRFSFRGSAYQLGFQVYIDANIAQAAVATF